MYTVLNTKQRNIKYIMVGKKTRLSKASWQKPKAVLLPVALKNILQPQYKFDE